MRSASVRRPNTPRDPRLGRQSAPAARCHLSRPGCPRGTRGGADPWTSPDRPRRRPGGRDRPWHRRHRQPAYRAGYHPLLHAAPARRFNILLQHTRSNTPALTCSLQHSHYIPILFFFQTDIYFRISISLHMNLKTFNPPKKRQKSTVIQNSLSIFFLFTLQFSTNSL